MGATNSLCDLAEILEDTKVLHDDAARASIGDLHMRHKEKALCYTAMLKEVRGWEDRRKRDRSVSTGADTNESAHDSLPALINRITRMQRANDSLSRGR